MYQVATNNYHPEIKEPTYRDVFNMWLDAYKNTVKPSTYLKAMQLFKAHILPVFGNHKINKITITFCQKALNNYAATYGSYRKLWYYVKTIFKYAIQLGYINKNVAEFVKYPKDTHEHIKYDFYTPDELKQFLTSVNNEYKPNTLKSTFFRVLAFTGMRKGELLALSWDDVNFNNHTISIKHSISYDLSNKPIISTPKNKSSVRCITIDDKTIKQLKLWQLQQRKEFLQVGLSNKYNLVFCSNRGGIRGGILSQNKPRTWANVIYTKYHLKKLRIHDFRHTHASILLSSGMQVKAVRAFGT